MSQTLYQYFQQNRDAIAAPTQRQFIEAYDAAFARVTNWRYAAAAGLMAPGLILDSSSLCAAGLFGSYLLYERHQRAKELQAAGRIDRAVLRHLRRQSSLASAAR